MASNLSPAFGYTVLYVKDVSKSVDFYAKAFGYAVRRLDESYRFINYPNISCIYLFISYHAFSGLEYSFSTENTHSVMYFPFSSSINPPNFKLRSD